MGELSRSDKKRLDNSYEFGSIKFWDCIEEIKNKDLDTEAVGMELLYQSVHFLVTKGWAEDELLNYIKNAYKDARSNQLFQQELSRDKVAHRQAGKLTDAERAVMVRVDRDKKILKKEDPENINTQELTSAKPEVAEMN